MLRLAQNQPMTRPCSARSLRPKHHLSQTVASAVSLRSQVVSKLSSWECCIQPNATYATAWLDHPSWRAGGWLVHSRFLTRSSHIRDRHGCQEIFSRNQGEPPHHRSSSSSCIRRPCLTTSAQFFWKTAWDPMQTFHKIANRPPWTQTTVLSDSFCHTAISGKSNVYSIYMIVFICEYIFICALLQKTQCKCILII